jgi:hypothetical protein
VVEASRCGVEEGGKIQNGGFQGSGEGGQQSKKEAGECRHKDIDIPYLWPYSSLRDFYPPAPAPSSLFPFSSFLMRIVYFSCLSLDHALMFLYQRTSTISL